MLQINPENLLDFTTQKCTLGCPILDRLLDGGVPCHSVTELVSESGCGKTQLCLQLLLCAQLPVSSGGLSGSSLYIHSEFPFPFRRLRQISLFFPSSNADPCDRIFVHAVESPDELLDILNRVEKILSGPPSSLPIKLIAVDSIAALFRSEFDNNPSDLKRRSLLFFKIAGKLKLLAKRFDLAVVVTNQVVDLVDSDGPNGLRVGNYGCLYSSGRRVCPALGLSWANCINSRLFLSRCFSYEVGGNVESGSGDQNGGELGFERTQRDQNGGELGVERTQRRMQVVFAPHLPESSCEFVIVREGVFGVGS